MICLLFNAAPGWMLAQSRASIRPLKVDAGGHYLVNEEGVPFFWLGDTAWKLFANLDEQEAHRYLTDRKLLYRTQLDN